MTASNWRSLAACRGLAPADPDSTHPWFSEDPRVAEEALAVCARCVVREACAAEGVGQVGIWGGVLRSAHGRVRMTYVAVVSKARRRGEAHRLRGLRWSVEGIGRSLGVTTRVVYRYLAEECGAEGCWCSVGVEVAG